MNERLEARRRVAVPAAAMALIVSLIGGLLVLMMPVKPVSYTHLTLPEGTEMVMPGDNTDISVKLIQPVAMDEGLRFAIREGGRTVGAGRVTKIEK